MNILICPDSFKGTLSSIEVCNIIESVIKEKCTGCETVKLPVADGGEGLCDALFNSQNSEKITVKTKGPFNEDMYADYLIINKNTAVIEMASCAGLCLAGDKANPLFTTTYGVGLMILDAYERGIRKILLGLGGSATNDCGIGMAKALGYDFLDLGGKSVCPIGKELIRIKKIVEPKDRLNIEITAACDVANPLYGNSGAAYVFAPQKGADEKDTELLDLGLKNIAEVIKRDLNKDISNLNGAGAAGGMGAGIVAFMNGSLKSGIDIVLDTLNFDEKLKNADAVITGEGKFDGQSVNGKVVSGICKRCLKNKIPVFALCGCMEENADYRALGIERIFTSTQTTKSIEEIKKTVKNDVKDTAGKLFAEILNYFDKNS